MVKVGINEDVLIDGVELDDKKRLVISFKQKTTMSLFEEMSASEVSDGDSAVNIMIFPFKVPDKKDMSDRQKQDRVISDIKNTRNVLLHILFNFYAKEDVKLDTYKGTGITKDTKMPEFMAKHLSQNILDKIWLNLAVEFKRLAIPLVQAEGTEFRLKLRRRSKEKHFATLPDKFLDSRPFIEPMSVPAEVTRVKFDEWELKEGLDDGTPASPSTADPIPAEEKDNMFETVEDDGIFNPDAPTDNI